MKANKGLKEYKTNKELDIEKIVKEYSAYVYTIIKNMTNQNIGNEDIEEIIADTFFILWKKQYSLNDNTKVSSYLAGIVRNLTKERLKDIKVNDNIADYENSLISNENLSKQFEELQQTELIEEALKKMNEEDNNIFRLYYYAGKKVKDISEELSITEFKVKTKLHRLRKKIKKYLIEGGYKYEQ